MLMGAAAFGRRDGRVALAAAAGGLAPDAPSFVLVLWAALVERRPLGEVFDQLYFSPEWQAILAPSHSAPLWLLLLGSALLFRKPLLTAFAASGLLHQLFDFALHAEDAHRHLWPLSDGRFLSPVSYWDPAHYGAFAAPLEAVLGVGLALLVRRMLTGRRLQMAMAGIAALYGLSAVALAGALLLGAST
jgi:hypothetical protein